MSLNDFIEKMPKAEVHVHLEGATQPDTLLMLAERNGVKLPAQDIDTLRKMYVFRNFDDFIEVYLMILSTIRKLRDFSDIVYAFGKEMYRQNIRYAEVTWTPQFYVRGAELQLPFSEVLDALNDGRQRAQDEWAVQMRWIPDIARNFPEYKAEMADYITSHTAREGGVVALGLGGAEIGFPPEMFEEAFAVAHERKVPVNPHAGETEGPASIWGAIKNLKAQRIGHGVRAIEDPELVNYLAEHQIPLEVNPTSNLCLQIYPSYEAHPLRRLHQAGCLVTINSDDPPLFNTTLTDEYKHAIHDMGFGLDELEDIALNAVRVSYLPEEEKAALLAEFHASYTQLKAEYGLM